MIEGQTLTLRLTLPANGPIPKAHGPMVAIARAQGAEPGDTVSGVYRRNADGAMVLESVELTATPELTRCSLCGFESDSRNALRRIASGDVRCVSDGSCRRRRGV